MAFRNIPPNGFPAIPDIEDLEGVEKDVSTLKTTTAGLAEDVSDLEEQKANQITIALTFNPESTYEVGDLVYYNGLTYRCTNEHTGEWDADDFAGTTIANELSELKSGLTNLHYHKVAESASTGTYADKLQSLNTAYSSLSLAQKLSAVLVLNGNDFYYPTNASGVFHTTFVASNTTLHVCASIVGTFYLNTDGTTTDSSATENNSVFSIWVAN